MGKRSPSNTPDPVLSEVQLDKHPVLGGKGYVYRRKEGGSFYLYAWVKAERKRLRKSLDTTDFEVAMRLAEAEVLQLLAKTQVGQKVFSDTLGDVVDAWEELQLKRLRAGEVRSSDFVKNRVTWFRKHLGNVFGLDTPVGDLRQSDWDRLVEQRRGTVKADTLACELSYVRNLVRQVGLKKGAVLVPEFDVKRPKWGGARSRRSTTFTPEEFRSFRKAVHGYVVPELREPNGEHKYRRDWKLGAVGKQPKRPGNFDQQLEHTRRVLLRYLFEVLAFSGCRPHELAGSEENPKQSALRWRDVVFLNKTVTGTQLNQRETTHYLAVLRVRDLTKTGSRSVSTLLGKQLESLKKWSKYDGPDDYVFADQCGQRAGRPVYLNALREHWKEVCRRQGLRGFDRFSPDLYSLRHYFATERLAAGVPPVFVAKTLGHSLQELFQTYEHVLTETEQFQRTLWSVTTPKDLADVGLQVVETDLE